MYGMNSVSWWWGLVEAAKLCVVLLSSAWEKKRVERLMSLLLCAGLYDLTERDCIRYHGVVQHCFRRLPDTTLCRHNKLVLWF